MCRQDAPLISSYLQGDDESDVCSLPGAREIPVTFATESLRESLVSSDGQNSGRFSVDYHYRATGKRLASTKLRHYWALRSNPPSKNIGFIGATTDKNRTDDNVVARVELRHSRLSGKKQVFFDGSPDPVLTTWDACLTWTQAVKPHKVRIVLHSERRRHTLRCEDLLDDGAMAPVSPRSSLSDGSRSSLPLPDINEDRLFYRRRLSSDEAHRRKVVDESKGAIALSIATELQPQDEGQSPLRRRSLSAPEVESVPPSARITPQTSPVASLIVNPSLCLFDTDRSGCSRASMSPMPSPTASFKPIQVPCDACRASYTRLKEENDGLRMENESLHQLLFDKEQLLKELQAKVDTLSATSQICARLSSGRFISPSQTMESFGLSDSSSDDTEEKNDELEETIKQVLSGKGKYATDSDSELDGELNRTNRLGLVIGNPITIQPNDEDLEDSSDLERTNRLGSVMLPSPAISPEKEAEILAIGSSVEDIDDDELGVTNPLGVVKTSELSSEVPPLANGMVASMITPLSAALVPIQSDGTPTSSDTPSGLVEVTSGSKDIPTTSPTAVDTQNIAMTPTLRGEASVASPMAETRSFRKSVNASSHGCVKGSATDSLRHVPEEQLLSQPSDQEASLESNSTAIEVNDHKRQTETVVPFSGRCFIEWPLS